jgi:hypothetical protein
MVMKARVRWLTPRTVRRRPLTVTGIGCIRHATATAAQRRAMASTKFSLVATPVGLGRCVLDLGGDPVDVLDQVEQGSVHFGDGRPTVLTLHETAAGHIEGEGIVRVVETVDDPAKLIVDFLEKVDPNELHRVAMEGLDASTTVSGAYLATLRRWATGEP